MYISIRSKKTRCLNFFTKVDRYSFIDLKHIFSLLLNLIFIILNNKLFFDKHNFKF